MAIIPTNWNWQPITPKTLIQNINAEKGLGFQAIPSFLATLLHEKKCVIRSGQREQEIMHLGKQLIKDHLCILGIEV